MTDEDFKKFLEKEQFKSAQIEMYEFIFHFSYSGQDITDKTKLLTYSNNDIVMYHRFSECTNRLQKILLKSFAPIIRRM
jgi:hypothetical protein